MFVSFARAERGLGSLPRAERGGTRHGDFEFVLGEVVEGFAFADEAGCGAFDEDFGGEWVGVVTGGHAHAVGAGGEDGEGFAACDDGEFSVEGEEVAGFAEWADDIAGFEAGHIEVVGAAVGLVLWADGGWPDEVEGVVEGRADEGVHAGVADEELFV